VLPLLLWEVHGCLLGTEGALTWCCSSEPRRWPSSLDLARWKVHTRTGPLADFAGESQRFDGQLSVGVRFARFRGWVRGGGVATHSTKAPAVCLEGRVCTLHPQTLRTGGRESSFPFTDFVVARSLTALSLAKRGPATKTPQTWCPAVCAFLPAAGDLANCAAPLLVGRVVDDGVDEIERDGGERF